MPGVSDLFRLQVKYRFGENASRHNYGGAVVRREHCGPAQLSVRGRVSRRSVRIDLVPRRAL